MLSSLIQSAKETERWVDREIKKDVCRVKTNNSSYRHSPTWSGTTTHGAGGFDHTGDDRNKVPKNRRQRVPSHRQGSNRDHAWSCSPRNSRSVRRSHPYHSNKHGSRIGPSSQSYNPTIPHGNHKRATGRSNDILSPYHPISSSQSPAQYKQLSPMYAAAPKFSLTSPAYSSISPVYAAAADVRLSSTYPSHVSSPAVHGSMAGLTKLDGSAMSYSPTSPTYAFCSPHYTNNYISATKPTNQPCKGSATYSPVYNKTVDSPKTGRNTRTHTKSNNEISTVASPSIEKALVDTIQNEISSQNKANSNTQYKSTVNANENRRKDHRLAYDPTQPQYSPTYNPAAMMDNWYDQEENGRLAYDPEHPEYFYQDEENATESKDI